MKKGFTLIELMAVIVILGILATVVAINVSPFLQRANFEKIRADISQIEKALELYKFNELKYPTTDQGLISLKKPPTDLKRPFLYPIDGYISDVPMDPWGNDYLLLNPGENGNIDVFSMGPDGVQGTDDDIGNWNLSDYQ